LRVGDILLSPSIAQTERCTNDLPGVVISTMCLFIVDIKILSIQAASGVAAKGEESFLPSGVV
jgi:hypothetical protein